MKLLDFILKNKRNIIILIILVAVVVVIIFTIKKEYIENPQPSISADNCLECKMEDCGTTGDKFCNKECTQFNMKSGKILCVKK